MGPVPSIRPLADRLCLITFFRLLLHLLPPPPPPLLIATVFGPFFGPASSLNITAYSDPDSEEYAAFSAALAATKALSDNPNGSIVGKNFEILENAWKSSTDAGKTWQIWGSPVVMGPSKGVNLNRLGEFVNPLVAPFVQGYGEAVLQSPAAAFGRALVAMDIFDQPWNPDDFSGVTAERAKILEFAATTNNPIILSGDVHDAWGWTLYERGEMTGEPVAVNLVTTGVTSPGWGPALAPFFAGNPLDETLGAGWWYHAVEDNFVGINEGLKYGNIENKGFFAVKATKVRERGTATTTIRGKAIPIGFWPSIIVTSSCANPRLPHILAPLSRTYHSITCLLLPKRTPIPPSSS